MKKEDINGHIDGNIVQIDAEVKQEKETKDKGGKVLRSGRNQGSISRVLSLAQDVDDAKSKPEDGVLTQESPSGGHIVETSRGSVKCRSVRPAGIGSRTANLEERSL